MESNSICCSDSLSSTDSMVYASCCAIEAYDTTVNLCCNEVVAPKDNTDFTCCGTSSFDINNGGICCADSNVVDATNWINGKCCGAIGYDAFFNSCVDDIVI
jgi:hypothetical protein